MNRRFKILLYVLVGLFGVFIFLETSRPDPLDWDSSYSIKDKIPYGTYIFYHLLQDKTINFSTIDRPPFEFLKDSAVTGTYIFVGAHIDMGKDATKRILKWVEDGNTLFIANGNGNKWLLDSLSVQRKRERNFRELSSDLILNLVNPELRGEEPYLFEHDSYLNYFELKDTLQQKVLGEVAFASKGNKKEINFLQIPMGKGKVILHSTPQAFTNLFLVKDHNYRYLEGVLAYLDLEGNVYYDAYYDPKYHKEGARVESSILYVLLHNHYLKWGYYFMLIGALLFILFEGKRKQRAIPIIKPLGNKSYEYVQTISGMYLDAKGHTAIAHKMIAQFLNFIRTTLRTPIDAVNEEFYERLSALTGNTMKDIRRLFQMLQDFDQRENLTKEDLITLNRAINSFKKNC